MGKLNGRLMEASTLEEIEDGLVVMYEHKHFGDWGLELVVSHECCWSAELRITPKPNDDGPDISIVFFATAGQTPLDVALEAYRACQRWVLDQPKGQASS